jgi:hypothetical protein
LKDWVDKLERGARAVRERVEAARAAKVPASAPLPAADGPLVRSSSDLPPVAHDEPPVVARLVVEIRSDGTRTIARGAIEDVATGERTTVEANGGTPLQLAASLASTLVTTPFSLGRAAGALVKARLARGAKR